MTDAPDVERSRIGDRAAVLLIFVGSMWLVRIIDTFHSGNSLIGYGIVPRTGIGLVGILRAPFIHANWPHLIANTIPLLVLGGLVMLRGIGEFVFVTFVCVVTGGFGTWLLGGAGQHIGASGVVFGYAGYLLFRSIFDRSILGFVVAAVVIVLYGSAIITALVPQYWISWSGHFFGFVGGFVAAKLQQPARERRPLTP